MKKGEKVGAITKENYKDVVARATEVRERLKEHYQEKGGFPSLRYVIENWGFQMSLKAMWRHRNAVMKELGIESVGKPTDQLPRPKKKPAEVETATQEETPVETTAETVTEEN